MASQPVDSQSCSSVEQGILIVGLACLDIVNVASRFPEEDQDMRVDSQRWCRGGNASNSSVILAQLGASVEYFGTLARVPVTDIVTQDLARYGVLHNKCVYHTNCFTPTSIVIVNEASGSRTILHGNRSLPELTSEDFDKLDLSCYKWIHFEGRNITEVIKMVEKIRTYNQSCRRDEVITTSVEVEKPREEYQKLFAVGDVVFVSKDYARYHGYKTAVEALHGFSGLIKERAQLICAWGEEGAWGMDEDRHIHHSSAFPPDKLLETLAAGDTFNAAVIFCLWKGKSLQDTLLFSCRLAGFKCGIQGLDISGFKTS